MVPHSLFRILNVCRLRITNRKITQNLLIHRANNKTNSIRMKSNISKSSGNLKKQPHRFGKIIGQTFMYIGHYDTGCFFQAVFPCQRKCHPTALSPNTNRYHFVFFLILDQTNDIDLIMTLVGFSSDYCKVWIHVSVEYVFIRMFQINTDWIADVRRPGRVHVSTDLLSVIVVFIVFQKLFVTKVHTGLSVRPFARRIVQIIVRTLRLIETEFVQAIRQSFKIIVAICLCAYCSAYFVNGLVVEAHVEFTSSCLICFESQIFPCCTDPYVLITSVWSWLNKFFF